MQHLQRVVSVVRHRTGVPELCIGDDLKYPEARTGSLPLVFVKPESRQVASDEDGGCSCDEYGVRGQKIFGKQRTMD